MSRIFHDTTGKWHRQPVIYFIGLGRDIQNFPRLVHTCQCIIQKYDDGSVLIKDELLCVHVCVCGGGGEIWH